MLCDLFSKTFCDQLTKSASYQLTQLISALFQFTGEVEIIEAGVTSYNYRDVGLLTSIMV